MLAIFASQTNVTIESGDNTYNAEEKHEFKQSGLSVSLGGGVVKAAEKVVSPAQRATKVDDDRLKALYAYEAEKQIRENADTLKKLGHLNKKDIGISVSLGSSKSESESNSQSIVGKASNIKAEQDVNIKATDGDIKIKGSNVEGKDITLDAKKNIEITASENTNVSKSDSKSSSASIGVDISFSGISGINVAGNNAKGQIKENGTTYNQSTVTAEQDLTTKSGKDTNIIGSKIEGETVKVNVGENLNLESLQDKETYDEKNSSSGFSFSADIKKQDAKKPNTLTNSKTTGSTSKGNIDSNYQSVTEQAEIHAGKGGFDIEVGKNTDLKGAVISSDATPDKNKISTDTLTYSDIQNKADYSASSTGYSMNMKDGKVGMPTPTPSMPVSGDADSTTKSSIALGKIEIKSNPNQDISNLSRDTSGSLNALGKIFDKKKVQEQQELANLFGQEAFKAIGDLAVSQRKKALTDAANYPKDSPGYKEAMARAASWDEGGVNKILLHTVAGGIMSDLGGNGFTSGAASAGLNEVVQSELAKIKDPGLHQLVSGLVGGVAAKIIGGNASVGASIAESATKNNWLSHEQQVEFANRLKKALVEGNIDAARRIIIEYSEWSKINSGLNPFNKEATEGLDDDGAVLLEQLQLYAALTNQTLTNNGLNYDLANLAAGNSKFALQLPENHGFDTSKTADTVDQINQPPETVDSVMDNGGSWNSAGQVVRADGTVCDNLPSRGDYLYSQGIEPSVNKDTNTWYISTKEGNYPVYSLGYVGDYYAKLGYKVELGNDGGHYVTAPDGSPWYTSAPLTPATTPPTTREVLQQLASDPTKPIASTIANVYLGVDNIQQGNYGEAFLNGVGAVGGASIIKGAFGSVGKVGQVADINAEGTVASQGSSKALVKDTGSISKNTENLRAWAKDNGWVQQNTAGGVEQWGVRNADGTFSWRLKLKPEASTREGLGAGSNQPRFDARLDDKGTYINPFTGETGGRGAGTHIPLGE